MKNLILNFVSVLLVGVLMFSCSKSEDELQVPVSNEKLNFADFEEAGVIHNQFLTNFKDNFQVDATIVSRDAAVEYVNQFNQLFADKMSIPDNEKQLFKNLLEENKRFVDYQAFYKEMFVSSNNLRSSGDDSQGLLLDDLDEAFSKDLIDEFEYEKLKLIGLKTKENFEGTFSDDELETLIIGVKEEWISKEYQEDSKYGRTLAYTLAISLASLEWWEENPDAASSGLRSTTALPLFVGADIAGAIYGGVSGGVGSYIVSGSVNWGSVGWGAGVGAVLGSTGAVGKLGGWISGLF
ncbi:MAG: hypothetical protein LBC48_08205 [Dysgonamonadaceae bacterium]|nr:hypothetical protein [Dysgonamonadaceae bacterium]